jgi:hypothetical protein
MSRFATTTTLLLTTAALAVPASAGAATVDASAHLETHSLADSGAALQRVHHGVQRARRLVARSESSLQHAYALTMAHGTQTSAQGMQASASFSAAAQAQGADLAAIVSRARGALKTAAADALARTGRLEAAVVAGLANDLEQQQGSMSAQQGTGVSAVGDHQASLTTSIVVTASGDSIRQSLQSRLDRATAAALVAQGKLAQAVADLRDRTQGQSQSTMAATQASLQQNGSAIADAISRGGRADVSFSIDNGTITLGQLAQRSVDAGGPAGVSASGEAHVAVGQGGAR